MTDTIEPALSAEEWAYWHREGVERSIGTACDAIAYGLHQDPAKLIALANDALPDFDPRKITPEWVTTLREAAAPFMPRDAAEQAARLERMADALASYLRPE